ncbi:hypothetical protein [Flavobacterium sp.]|uniref:hypothetical protein n=1 Tax=Flavobacterium sp. TaxID=239 RepID=UPI0011FC4913|nr:hypothetical protein [Flavobacterium sp.]RZJ71076.1 MAG: hypothetical protein EOO49_11525 [Flavobacterium sp.]
MKDIFTSELSQRLIYASIGIMFSFWWSSRSGKTFTFWRIIFEMLQGFFVSWGVAVSTKEFTQWSLNFTLFLVVVASFFGSRIVAFLSKDAFEAAKSAAISRIKSFGKKKEPEYEEYDVEPENLGNDT